MKKIDWSYDWLEDPEVFQVNRLNAHSDHVYYKSSAAE